MRHARESPIPIHTHTHVCLLCFCGVNTGRAGTLTIGRADVTAQTSAITLSLNSEGGAITIGTLSLFGVYTPVFFVDTPGTATITTLATYAIGTISMNGGGTLSTVTGTFVVYSMVISGSSIVSAGSLSLAASLSTFGTTASLTTVTYVIRVCITCTD